MITVFAILAITIALFLWNRIPLEVVALLSSLALYLCGVLDLSQALSGFSNVTVITITGLFVIGGALFTNGIADRLADRIIRASGGNFAKLLCAVVLLATGLSSFLSDTGTVAVLLPAVVAAAKRLQVSPSKLLLPLAGGALLGGRMTLIGTPPNIVLVDVLQQSSPGLGFSFFEFAWVGVPLLAAYIAYLLVVGHRLLPDHAYAQQRQAAIMDPGELQARYHLDGRIFKLRVRDGSPVVGMTLNDIRMSSDFRVNVIQVVTHQGGKDAIERSLTQPVRALVNRLRHRSTQSEAEQIELPRADQRIEADDVLYVEGDQADVQAVAVACMMAVQPIQDGEPAQASGDNAALSVELDRAELLDHEVGMVEAALMPRSRLIGKSLAELRFGSTYKVQVLGIKRGDQTLSMPFAQSPLKFGDVLLVRGPWSRIEALEAEREDLVLMGKPASRLAPSDLGLKGWMTILWLGLMLAGMLTGVAPTVVCVLLTCAGLVLTGCVDVKQAYSSISWTSVILIAAMIPMSEALRVTGGASFLAEAVINAVDGMSTLWLLAGVYMLTMGLSQFVSNTATTILVAPIAMTTAQGLGVSPLPILMMVGVGASSAFLTPIASPVNLLVLGPGGYSFKDFAKFGLPFMIVVLTVALLVVPRVWPLHP